MMTIREYGAVGDGVHDDTAAIAATVDACRKAGGGTVFVPSGTYVCTPFQLYSGMNLHLEAGAVLRGSTDVAKYVFEQPFPEAYQRPGLIRVVDARNVSITGTGTIDCRGMEFMDCSRARAGDPGSIDYEPARTRQKELYRHMDSGLEDGPAQERDRPGFPIQFVRCENVTLRDFTVLDSPFWTVTFHDCRYIVVSGLTILNNLLIPNSDGIHFQACRNARISDCHMECGDDCIAFTGYGPEEGWTENVVVSNCSLSSRSSALRIGYGKLNIRNLMFHNITITGSNRGIGVFQRDEGILENILFSNIVIETRLHSGHWWGHGEPIHVSSVKHSEANGCGTLRNIRFTNIFARGEAGMIVYGQPESVIEDVTFDHVQFEVVPSLLADRYGGNMDLRPIDDIRFGVFEHHECGLFARHVHGLQLHHVDVRWKEPVAAYFRHGVECHECEDVVVDGYTGSAPHASEGCSAFHEAGCRNVNVLNSAWET